MNQLRKATKSTVINTLDRILIHISKGQYVLSSLKWLKNLLVSFDDKFLDQEHRKAMIQVLDGLKTNRFKYNLEDSADIDFIRASL